MYRLLLSLCCAAAAPGIAMATTATASTELAAAPDDNATGKVSGRITDENGEPMIGVTVREKGTQNATITDMDGNFSLPLKSSTTIEASYMGYLVQDFKAGPGQSLSLQMKPDTKMLDEVVSIGYGTVRKRDMLGAISQVKSEDIKLTPSLNAMEGLAGKIAGLDITRSSGQAGTSPALLLRGNRSLTSDCSPLFVIDGVAGGSIENLNPNDIETIEVLKDASSTAIYGAEGANGVIIVTTKQGTQGKTQIDFNAYVGINAFPSYPSTLSGDAWVNYLKEGYVARYGEEPTDLNQLFNTAGLSDGAIQAYNEGKWIDWKDEVLHTGSQQNYNISIRGGNERHQSYVSGGYQLEKGLYKNDRADFFSFRAGSKYKVNNLISAGVQATFSYKNREARQSRLNKTLNQIPLGEVYNADGTIKQHPIDDMDSYINILADDQEYAYKRNIKSMYFNVVPYLEITPVKGLMWKTLFNASFSNSRTGTWDGLDTYMKLSGSQANIRTANYNTGNGWGYTWQNILTYNFTIKDMHDITLTGVTEYSKSKSESSTAQSEDFDYDQFLYYNLNAGFNPYVQSSYSEKTKMSYALRAAYSFLGRYLLSASIRWDGASQLYKDKRWCAFPAVSAGWRISDEKFMEGTRKWLDNLKLRVGYGVTGNSNISPYSSLTLVTNSTSPITLGTTELPTYVLTEHVSNYDLTWEKSYNWNIGLDFGFLNGRIDGSFEYYFTDTKGVLYDRPLPTAFGLYNAKTPYKKTSNIARIKNRGVELTINTRNIVKKDFTWTSTFTFAKNVEKLKEIDLGNNVSVDELVALNLFLDNPVNTFYGYKKLGIWQQGEEDMAACFGNQVGTVKVEAPGLVWDDSYTYSVTTTSGETETTKNYKGAYYKPEEDNEDGTHNYYTAENPYVIGAADKQILGSKTPDFNIGFQNQFRYKNFDLTIMAHMRWGQMINGELLSYTSNTNIPDCYNYWTPSNPTNAYPRPIQGYSSTTAQKESMYYVDGSFIKIKNITLGYTLPKSALRKLNITNARIYGTITNPIIIAKEHDLLKGMDPESNASDSYPLYKTLVFGINISL